ncbi:hypothetical protein [Pseudomonas indica]|uniref:hypothetical protein n=1 Tax=Pseudomonas indica TaxID=137658 RepID=UPI000BAB4948|nr:hypothetical protein [Pseudomonas indica]PAU54411.1 hypothetical protein BZL42_21165 [Pseudomonas indica]
MSVSNPSPSATRPLGRRVRLFGVLGPILLSSACAVHVGPRQPPQPQPPVQQPPVQQAPIVRPPPVQAPPPSSAPKPQISKTHPRYAPPPHVASHWDNRLGVYVVEGRDLYYRERLFYRKERGNWVCSGRPDGPWEPIDIPNVPPGLRNR